jgi:hypothetical protein
MPSAHCVTYTDDNSVGKSALNDLIIGENNQILACNSSRINVAKVGDIVVNVARGSKEHWLMIVRLVERADNLRNTWKHSGGTEWKYCWRVEILVPHMIVTKSVQEDITYLAIEIGIRPTNILNSRLCNKIATPVLEGLVSRYSPVKTEITPTIHTLDTTKKKSRPKVIVRITPENANNYIGHPITFMSRGVNTTKILLNVSQSGKSVYIDHPDLKNNLQIITRNVYVSV